jgi:hypothetical protein
VRFLNDTPDEVADLDGPAGDERIGLTLDGHCALAAARCSGHDALLVAPEGGPVVVVGGFSDDYPATGYLEIDYYLGPVMMARPGGEVP